MTQWNDSSKTKDVRVASTCLFGDTYETTIGRKLKAEDLAKHPGMGSVGDKVCCNCFTCQQDLNSISLYVNPTALDRFSARPHALC